MMMMMVVVVVSVVRGVIGPVGREKMGNFAQVIDELRWKG